MYVLVRSAGWLLQMPHLCAYVYVCIYMCIHVCMYVCISAQRGCYRCHTRQKRPHRCQKRPTNTIKRDLLTLSKETYWHYQKRPTNTIKRDLLRPSKETYWHCWHRICVKRDLLRLARPHLCQMWPTRQISFVSKKTYEQVSFCVKWDLLDRSLSEGRQPPSQLVALLQLFTIALLLDRSLSEGRQPPSQLVASVPL